QLRKNVVTETKQKRGTQLAHTNQTDSLAIHSDRRPAFGKWLPSAWRSMGALVSCCECSQHTLANRDLSCWQPACNRIKHSCPAIEGGCVVGRAKARGMKQVLRWPGDRERRGEPATSRDWRPRVGALWVFFFGSSR